MPKFQVLKDGINESLIADVTLKVGTYLANFFEEHEYTQVDNIYSFGFGSVNVEIRVVGWHSEDVLVQVFSYVAEEVTITQDLTDELLRLNATTPFGSFGLTFDNSVIYSYSLAGKNLDENEFLAAVQTVATIADEYDEKIKELGMATAN